MEPGGAERALGDFRNSSQVCLSLGDTIRLLRRRVRDSSEARGEIELPERDLGRALVNRLLSDGGSDGHRRHDQQHQKHKQFPAGENP